jgi:GTP-binding protein EngB required for normal cell division
LKEPTLLIMVVGVPNVGKSALINSIHKIATSRFPGMITWEENESSFISYPCFLFMYIQCKIRTSELQWGHCQVLLKILQGIR